MQMAGAANMKLKGAMAERGLTVGDIARIVGCSYGSALAKINGKAKFTFDDMDAIKEEFGLDGQAAWELFSRKAS